MGMYLHGGRPQHINETATASVLQWNIPKGTANYFYFRNNGEVTVKLTLSGKADADAGKGIDVVADGVFEGPCEIASFHTKAASSTAAFEAIAFVRIS